LESLARRARAETPPVMQLRVAAVISQCAAPPAPLRWGPLIWPAALAAGIALVVLSLTLTQQTTSAATDSLTPLFTPMQVELP
jgi:hypothetical protein